MACGGADIPSASERMPIPQSTMTRSGQADAPRGNKRPPKARVMQYFRMRSDGLYICLLCEAINPRTKQRTYKRSKDSSTNTFWRHLQQKHSEIYAELKGYCVDQAQPKITEVMTADSSVINHLTPMTPENTKEVIVRFVCLTDSPWVIVDNEGFKVMWKFATRSPIDPPGSKAIKAAAKKLYFKLKEQLKVQFESVENVALTMDAWTAPNFCGLLGITIHWVDKHCQMRECVLAIREIVGKHGGVNMGDLALQVLDEFGLTRKVTAITTDNAKNNTTMMEHIMKKVQSVNPHLSNGRHVPCLAHILNLAVQAAMQTLRVSLPQQSIKLSTPIGSIGDTENEYAADISDNDDSVLNDSFDELLKFPDSMIGDAVTRVRVLVAAIRKSTQRRREYVKACIDLKTRNRRQISLDCPTRWNSTYEMLLTAIGNRPAVDFMGRHILGQSDKDLRIAKDEWELLKVFVDILKPFHSATQRATQSKAVTITDVVRLVKGLLSHIKTKRDDMRGCNLMLSITTLTAQQNMSIESACTSMTTKLMKYLAKLQDNEAVTVAAMFDPFHKGACLDPIAKTRSMTYIQSRLPSNLEDDSTSEDNDVEQEDDWADTLIDGAYVIPLSLTYLYICC